MSQAKNQALATFNKMMENDHFSRWLGIELVSIDAGKCCLKMLVRHEMLNGFSIAHGGVLFALADSALAFAANTHNKLSVSLDVTASYATPCREGDVLVAEAIEQTLGKTTAIYDVRVRLEHSETLVALFRGNVFRTSREVVV